MFNWSKQVILLTGGTGSFGQAFTKTVLKLHPPKSLRIYSRDEYKQFEMEKIISHPHVRYLIGDVRDKDRLQRAMDGVTLVIHAAAMKQIEACEYNPTEAIKTNINGSMNVIETALNANVEKVMGIITDKAVSPVNLYGATKLCMEKLMIQGNVYTGKNKTTISCVRYGNVAGSRGSVIPVFIKQKENGKFTVTHKDMTRFWITLEEAVAFVISSIEKMKGGEVFIPKMPSFKIIDLVKAIDSKVKIQYIGVRSGEKIHEDLVSQHESRNIAEFKNYYILSPDFEFWNDNKKTNNNGNNKVIVNFSYNSGNNKFFLTVKQLEKQISNLLV
ncbi:MAG: UDP-N-acetylglucosamine 4,6-dehydratase [Candidatus Gottesmanbacteria bacterium GW2011_GWA1_34_13]|uniref:UDP-N-acetylglucosamine 4,6-dehydratase n=1 Tax=Candidatus Gottesmanbacteria bacterium GW2011_GWA1_34_13 TaxID=1618434 RepID=A0A0G0ASV4_9BACT|nr:MAG: UDP-N-acetylglucosamine 4,6-dehydratase [Candidatus Gottesmanbacteria bacterium GW2011_GWA1_34_13]